MKNVTITHSPRRPVGLGDAVAFVAEPIRVALGIPKCGGCKDRQAFLNKIAPNIGLSAPKPGLDKPPSLG